MSITATTAQRSSTAARPPRRTRALAVGGAAAAALCVWAVARLLGADLMVRLDANTADLPVGPVTVAIVSVLAGLAGWGLLALLERFTARARGLWIILALVVLALSLIGPLDATATTATKAALACMHLAVAAVLVPVLVRTVKVRR